MDGFLLSKHKKHNKQVQWMLSKTTSSVPGSISPKGSSKKKSVYIYGKICNSYINFRIIFHRKHQNGSGLTHVQIATVAGPSTASRRSSGRTLDGWWRSRHQLFDVCCGFHTVQIVGITCESSSPTADVTSATSTATTATGGRSLFLGILWQYPMDSGLQSLNQKKLISKDPRISCSLLTSRSQLHSSKWYIASATSSIAVIL